MMIIKDRTCPAHNYIHSPVVDLVGHGRAVKECKSGEDVNSTKLTASDHYIVGAKPDGQVKRRATLLVFCRYL